MHHKALILGLAISDVTINERVMQVFRFFVLHILFFFGNSVPAASTFLEWK